MIIFLCLSLFTYDLFIDVIINLGQRCPKFLTKGHGRYCWMLRGCASLKIALSGAHKSLIHIFKIYNTYIENFKI